MNYNLHRITILEARRHDWPGQCRFILYESAAFGCNIADSRGNYLSRLRHFDTIRKLANVSELDRYAQKRDTIQRFHNHVVCWYDGFAAHQERLHIRGYHCKN